jgi:hypothetical protein
LIDIGLTISYLQQVTIDMDEYASSVQAQTMVARGDIIIPSGPVDVPTVVPISDVSPDTFNINPQAVETEDLDSFLQSVVFQWGILWSIDPHFVATPAMALINWGNGQFYVQGASYTINAGSLTATQNQVLIGTLTGGEATLSYEPISYTPGPDQVIMGSYDFTNKELFLVGMNFASSSGVVPASSVSYIPTSPLSATTVQGALDQLAEGIAGSAEYTSGEILTPAPDGMNNVFHTSVAPTTDKEILFYNGQALERGIGKDYVITGNTITFAFVPEIAAALTANYFHT